VYEQATLDERTGWSATSPLATIDVASLLREMRTDGPVAYLVAYGYRDDESFDVVGAFWLSADEERGGFLVHPDALWAGSEIARNYRSALDREWTHPGIFDYWAREGFRGIDLMLDRRQRVASSLRDLWTSLTRS
jgi:hypothetical protein